MTRTTSTAASASVCHTPSIARSMNSDESVPTCTVSPRGRSGARSAIIALAARATSSVFAPDCRTMPSPTPVCPLKRKRVYGFSGPCSTRATSPSRTR